MPRHKDQLNIDNIDNIDKGYPHIKFFGHSTAAASRAYSEKQLAYWAAVMMLGGKPNAE